MNKKQIFLTLVKNSRLSPKKMLNLMRGYKAYLMKKTRVRAYPPVLMIEPTNYCNLKCPLCPIGEGTFTPKRGSMKFDDYRKIMDEMGDYLLNLTLWNYGEPFMNKEIYSMIDYAKKKGIFIRISTNGHFLDNVDDIKKLINSKLDNLIICLDGASQETFLKYRKQGNFNIVVSNIKRIVDEKKKLNSPYPFIELQFIIMKHNEHEISRMRELAKEIGVDKLTLKTLTLDISQEDNKDRIAEFLPSSEKLSRYEMKEGKLKRKAGIKNDCKRLWLSSVINWDGSVTACCYDPNREFELGNVFKEGSFRKVWNNDNYRRFRKIILKNKKSVKMCENCPGKLMGMNLE